MAEATTTTAAAADTTTAAASTTTVANTATTTQNTAAANTTVTNNTAAATGAVSWPNNWREVMANGDEKVMARLQRFVSPPDIFTSYRALEQRVSSGELKAVTPFPDKGTPEQQSAWRKENGIPEKHDAYDLNIGDGLVIGEEDKPWIDQYLKTAHADNVPNSVVKSTLKWYFGYKDAQAEARTQADGDVARRTVDTLRTEWGTDYRVNMNGIEALLSTAPDGVAQKLKASRMADGTPVMSDPDTLRYLATLARTINPVSTVVPAGDEAAMAKSIDSEIAHIREVMAKDRKKYNSDEKMQKRYRELIDAQTRLKPKG